MCGVSFLIKIFNLRKIKNDKTKQAPLVRSSLQYIDLVEVNIWHPLDYSKSSVGLEKGL